MSTKQLSVLKSQKKSIDGLFRGNKLPGHLEGRGGYVDRHLKDKAFMSEIGPGAYEGRKAVIPTNLPKNIAPAALAAFGRLSLSPVAASKKRKQSTIDY